MSLKVRIRRLEARRLKRQIRGIVAVEDDDALAAAGLYRAPADRLPDEPWAAGEEGQGFDVGPRDRLVRRDACEAWAARMGYALIVVREYDASGGGGRPGAGNL